jgi:cytochrome c2
LHDGFSEHADARNGDAAREPSSPHRLPVHSSLIPSIAMRMIMKRMMLVLCLAAATPINAQAQDAAAGEKVYAVCRPCHQIGETAKNGIGPVLNGLFGRKSGTIEGYSYTDANKNSGITWEDSWNQDGLCRIER